MRTLATAIILIFGAVLIFVHQRYSSALSDALVEETGRVPVPLGPIDSDAAPALRFAIQNVQRNQRVTLADGKSTTSDWTVFDCIPDEDPGAAFRLAMSPIPPMTDQMQIGSSAVIIWVTDRDAGARLVDLFADILGQRVPEPRMPEAPLVALKIGMTVLGRQLPAGDGQWIRNSGSREEIPLERGPWTATRWFIEYDGLESEAWFNFDLNSGRGEIVQKSDDDTGMLIEALSTCLRDGPRPPRTPADDPRLTDFGPHVRNTYPTGIRAAGSYFFTPGSSLITISMDTESLISMIRPSTPEQVVDLIQLEGIATAIICLDENDERFLIQESSPTPIDGGTWWLSPQRIWIFDRKTNEKRPILGPWGEFGAIGGSNGVSPDGRYILINVRRVTSDGERIRAAYFYDLRKDHAVKTTIDATAEPIRWTGGGAKGPLRCEVLAGGNWRFNPDYQRASYSIDPVTGAAETIPDITSDDPTISPDGKLRIDFTAGEKIDVIDMESGSLRGSFRFHPDDQRFAREGTIAWVSPRYLLFRGKRLATIDVETLKMCYLTAVGDQRSFQFSPDFNWAAESVDGELHIAEVVVDAGPPTPAPITSARDSFDAIDP